MIMGNSSFVGIIIYGLWIALVITLPILVVIVVARAVRWSRSGAAYSHGAYTSFFTVSSVNSSCQ